MTRWLDDVRRDVQYAVRTLRRTRGFTAVAVLTLALGIGANTAIFSVVNAVLLRPLPYHDPDRLVRIFGNVSGAESSSGPARRVPSVSVSDLAPLRAQTPTLSHVTFYLGLSSTLTGREEAIKLEGMRVLPDMFPMLGARALVGRTFESGETVSGADAVVILSHATWQRYFGGKADILGQRLMLDGRQYAVVGVMPRGFWFADQQVQFWVPFVPANFPDMGASPIVRLKDGVSIQTATAEVTTILQQLRANRPATGPYQLSGYELIGLQDLLVAPVRPALIMLAGAVGFVLLIACVNVANLLLARSAGRQREIAIRRAIGAGRGRLAVAVALAAIGIYGVMAYSVTHRTREIGIRMALGAERSKVMGLGLGQSLPLIGFGLAVGLAGATAITRYLQGMLFGLTPLDPVTFIAVSLMFGAVAALASYVPARRATKVDPLVALRCE